MSKVLAWEKIFANPIHHFNFCIAYLRTLENSLDCDNLDKTATATIAVAWLALSQRSIKKDPFKCQNCTSALPVQKIFYASQ